MAHPSWENNPQLFAEVNLKKNAELTFNGKPVHVLELACGTNKKLDWICKKCQNDNRQQQNKHGEADALHARQGSSHGWA